MTKEDVVLQATITIEKIKKSINRLNNRKLQATTVLHLQEVKMTCNKYGKNGKMKINPKKTNIMLITNEHTATNIQLEREKLEQPNQGRLGT